MKRAALYLRVSTQQQHSENQLEPLQQFCKERGFEVVKVYAENGSAWTEGHQPQWKRLIADASHRHFDVVVTWSLDRITREGIDTIFLRIKTLKSYGVTLLSYQESWLETLGTMADLFIALLSWVANFESGRRSERTKAGIARKKLHGGGARGPDKKKRKRRTIKRPVYFEPEGQAQTEKL
jgi:DNA invertase Pin-like site-specific DNA recombinase